MLFEGWKNLSNVIYIYFCFGFHALGNKVYGTVMPLCLYRNARNKANAYGPSKHTRNEHKLDFENNSKIVNMMTIVRRCIF
jgi:hypothetical protein